MLRRRLATWQKLCISKRYVKQMPSNVFIIWVYNCYPIASKDIAESPHESSWTNHAHEPIQTTLNWSKWARTWIEGTCAEARLISIVPSRERVFFADTWICGPIECVIVWMCVRKTSIAECEALWRRRKMIWRSLSACHTRLDWMPKTIHSKIWRCRARTPWGFSLLLWFQ